MARKKKHEEHENLERWLVSYADFITLLFATFVVLYALSQIDLAKFKDMKISLAEAFAPTIFKSPPGPGPGITPGSESILPDSKPGTDGTNLIPDFNPNLEVKQAEAAKKEIEEAIEAGDLEGIEAKLDKRGLVISLVDSIFFDSGSAAIRKQAIKNLDKVALMIKTKFPKNKIRVEGHTDNTPIHTSAFPSNWELSAARASSVVRHLIQRYKMPKKTFSAVGYADSVPIASDKTSEGRQKNRRVEIVILNSSTLEQENSVSATFASAKHSAQGKTKAPKESNIQIIKGGKIKANISDVNNTTEQTDQQDENINSDDHTTQQIQAKERLSQPEPTKTEAPKHYTPIEMPVKSTKNKPPIEILEVETKRY